MDRAAARGRDRFGGERGADRIGHNDQWRYSPSLFWPSDRSWLVASEVDFDSTLVGGSADLIEAIVGSPDLEAWRVEPDDSLTCDADKINVAS